MRCGRVAAAPERGAARCSKYEGVPERQEAGLNRHRPALAAGQAQDRATHLTRPQERLFHTQVSLRLGVAAVADRREKPSEIAGPNAAAIADRACDWWRNGNRNSAHGSSYFNCSNRYHHAGSCTFAACRITPEEPGCYCDVNCDNFESGVAVDDYDFDFSACSGAAD